MISLVGYTGFVGSNIHAAAKDEIQGLYNSKNIEAAYGTKPELLIYAGLRAEKYLANNAPEQDMAQIRQAEENIRKIAPEKLVLISTIDVFKTPKKVDERTVIDMEGLPAYGYNRYQLELWVRENYPDAMIIRLPGLYGKGIRKNFIYDYINVIPFMLRAEKFAELSEQAPDLSVYYTLQDNGFYRCSAEEKEKKNLRKIFQTLGFSALNFTDSRSRYQFYPLENLWKDIKTAMDAGIKLWHPATEPVSSAELYHYLSGGTFFNELDGVPADYDYRTVYDAVWNGAHGYIIDKQTVMQGIKKFVLEEVEAACTR